jgi:histidinol-phosphate aminotransferase
VTRRLAAAGARTVLDLVRPDLRDFAGYASARRDQAPGSVWLNANENPWPVPGALNRYPDPQPAALRAALAALYGTTPERLLVGRGSDEAIDLLVRALCRPGRDAVVTTSPVFGMYAASARLQAAPLVEVPLIDGAAGFHADLDAVARAALASEARLVFLCSPGNPTGELVELPAIARLACALEGRALLVVDEAYIEYAAQASAIALMEAHPNLAVLRTLSKAHGLAAARLGALVAPAELVRVLRNCQAPYPLPAPCVSLALEALAPAALARTRERVAQTRRERERVLAAVKAMPGLRRVYASQANFLLLRFAEAQAAWQRLLARGVVVRDMRGSPQLADALRISLGTPAENDAMLAALEGATP